MPFDKNRYPKEWPQIRARIQKRAGNKCEWCGVANHAVGARDRFGNWHDEDSIDSMNSDQGLYLFDADYKIIRIVCTTAHIHDPDPMNCADDNLAFLCQKCHNGHDTKSRAANAAKTRGAKKRAAVLATGQMELLEC